MKINEIKKRLETIEVELSEINNKGLERIKSQDFSEISAINKRKEELYSQIRELQVKFMNLNEGERSDKDSLNWLVDYFEKKKTISDIKEYAIIQAKRNGKN